MLSLINDLTNMSTGVFEALDDFGNALGAFPSRRPVLTTVVLTALVCAIGWPATHPHNHPKRGRQR